MEVNKDSFVDENEFDFENIIPYFKDPVARIRSNYETLMDPLSDKIQHLTEDKRKKYGDKYYCSSKCLVLLNLHFSQFSHF